MLSVYNINIIGATNRQGILLPIPADQSTILLHHPVSEILCWALR
jgi:hypothetical protein